MIEVTIHDEAGRIKRSLTMPDLDALAENLDVGDEYVMGTLPIGKGYVEEGEYHPFPEKPGPWAVWDYAAKAWHDPRTPEYFAAELAAAIADGKARLNGLGARFELHFITPLPGQVEKYKRKESHARAYLEAYHAAHGSGGAIPYPADDDPRWSAVAAEAGPGLTGETLFHVAIIYVTLAEQWYAILDAYEPLRIAHVNRVEAATTTAEVDTAVASFQAGLEDMASSLGIGAL